MYNKGDSGWMAATFVLKQVDNRVSQGVGDMGIQSTTHAHTHSEPERRNHGHN